MTDLHSEQLTEPIDTHEDDLDRRPPPSWPKWIGGLAIAFGALFFTCGGLGAAMAPFQAKMMEGLLDGAPMPDGMVFHTQDWVLLGVGIISSLMLLFGGIFCVMRVPLSRVLILIWGVVSIPLSLYQYTRQMDKQESIRQWAQQYPDTQYGQMLNAQGATGQQIGEIAALVLTVLFGILIPAFFLLWFGFIKTKPEQFLGSVDDLL